jgi:hypothetical protein
MHKIIITLIFISLSNLLHAQNFVINPGLDSMITCPGFGQFNATYIYSWDKPTVGSSDYYNSNCAGILPIDQVPRSGNSYAGIICYNFGTEYREYITGMLTSPLQAGLFYEVEFYVSLNDGYIQAIEEVGAYFSATPPGFFSNALHISVSPQVVNISGPLDDTSAWIRISSSFQAMGGEQYITIGNFNNDTLTTITQPGSVGSYGAYYFVDDVSVTFKDSITAINSLNNEDPIIISELAEGKILIRSGSFFNSEIIVSVFDLSGRENRSYKIIKGSNLLITEELISGMYIVQLVGQDVYLTKKINVK